MSVNILTPLSNCNLLLISIVLVSVGLALLIPNHLFNKSV